MGYVQQPLTAGPEMAADSTARVASMIVTLPVRLWDVGVSLVTGGERDPNGPLSVVGVGRLAGEVAATDAPILNRFAFLLGLLGSLNIALFVFNLIPLLRSTVVTSSSRCGTASSVRGPSSSAGRPRRPSMRRSSCR